MSAFRPQPKGFATKAIHAGQEPEQWAHMEIVPPIVMSTTFKQLAPNQPSKYAYGRSGNPTRSVLEKCLASLDNGKFGLAFCSGPATTTTITQLLNAGDHLISCDQIYGGTNQLFETITSRHGIEVDLVDGSDLFTLRKTIKRNTRLIWIETPTNPLLKVVDIEAIAKLAHSYETKITVVVDNSMLTSYFQRPLELGADIVAYSVSRYMNGHSDVIMGAIVTNDGKLYQRLKFLQNACGAVPSPFDCYQANRSLKTLALRMERQCKTSVEVAKFLESHPKVHRVLHPALPSHLQHELVLKQTYGHSGIMSFYIKAGTGAEPPKFLNALETFTLADCMGGVESVAEIPAVMTHATVPKYQRRAMVITDSLVRLSIGLEDAEDLINDLQQALTVAFS